MKTPPLVLVFSASDGTGGAGTLCDCRAIGLSGAWPLAILTAQTAQNLSGVQRIWNTPPAQVRAQYNALRAAPVQAVKIGVVGSAAAAIGGILKALNQQIPVVWDPVLSPTVGAAFANKGQIQHMLKYLAPHILITTPNRAELLALSKQKTIADGAAFLHNAGVRYVLVTDTRPGVKVRHEMYEEGAIKPVWLGECRRRAGDYHGSGCFFSSVLTSRLALGDTPLKAAQAAHKNTLSAINRAIKIPAIGHQHILHG